MKNVTPYFSLNSLLVLACLLFCTRAIAQDSSERAGVYILHVQLIGKDSSFESRELKLDTNFNSEPAMVEYINRLPGLMGSQGYPLASVDSVWSNNFDTWIRLYTGRKIHWVSLRTDGIEPSALESTGYREKNFSNKPLNFTQVQLLQERLLQYYEKEGYPFATVKLDSMQLGEDKVSAVLRAEKGVLYHIDSIRVYGKAKISKRFLQRYLYISNGSPYNKQRLADVDKRILELPYLNAVQPSDLSMLGSGAILNLYLQSKKSSQVNFIVGFLPSANNTGKLQVTGDVNLDLKNLLGTGEGILLKWQQLQPKSPRLNLGFNQPYIFNSAFGINFLFDLFKKDSSFLQVNGQLGLQYLLSANETGKIFMQLQNTTLLAGAIDTNQIINEKKLPLNIDVSSVNVGINYEWIKTNYRYNPRSGNELNIATVVGIKKVKRNNEILGIKDPSFNYGGLYDSIGTKNYQLRVKLAGAHYFPLGKLAVFKAAFNGGFYTSPVIFRNELFQIGGYNLLRGFDEQSIYATRYAVATAELRYVFDLNSHIFGFLDYGVTKNKYQVVNVNNNFLGGGIGLVYEAKLGLINISYAIGKRNDVKFNLRESSKLHFGYVNYF